MKLLGAKTLQTKSLFLLLLCCLFAFSSAHAQKGDITYSPSMYKELKARFYSSEVQKNIATRHKDRDQQRKIETEYLKFMALSPQSKLQKIKAMGQCLVSDKLLTQSELKLITDLFAAFKSGNEKAAVAASKKIRSSTGKSPTMKAIVSTLRENDGGTPLKTNSQGGDIPQSQSVDDAADVIENGSTVAGGVIGAIFGPAGIIVGTGLGKANGKASGGALKKLHNWLFGKGKEFMPGPNGEDCTPPLMGW